MVVMCALDIVFNALFIFPTGTVRLGSLALPGARLGTAGAALGTRVPAYQGLCRTYVRRVHRGWRRVSGRRQHTDTHAFQFGDSVGHPYTAGVAARAPLGTVRRMGGHVPGAVRPWHTLSDTAGRQALAAARKHRRGVPVTLFLHFPHLQLLYGVRGRADPDKSLTAPVGF